MKKVGIIGYQGVGAAHAVATVRSGYGVVDCIVDIDTNAVMSRLAVGAAQEVTFTNSWGDINETATQLHGVLIITVENLTKENVEDIDLWIVATPSQFKQVYVEMLFDKGAKRILVEKPFPQILNYDDRVSVGYEWLHHPMLDTIQLVNNVPTVIMFHNEPTKEHYGTPETDLLPHCLGIGLRLGASAIMEVVKHNTQELTVATSRGPITLSPGTYIIDGDVVYTLPWVDMFDQQLLNLNKYKGMDRIVEAYIRNEANQCQ